MTAWTDMAFWLAGAAASAVLVGTGSYVLAALVVNRMMVQPRMAQAVGGNRPGAGSQRVADGVHQVKFSVSRLVGAVGRLMPVASKDRDKLAANLHNAGYRSANAVTTMLGVKFACLVSGLVIGLVVVTPMLAGPYGLLAGIVVGVLGGVVLNVVPELLLRRLALSRLHNLNSGFAEALDLLVVCLESGLTFETGLKRMVENLRSFQPVLAREFHQAMLDMSVHGRSRGEALGFLADRVDSQHYRDFAVTVAQAERHGTPLGEALRKLAGSARVDAISRMQEKMARLPTLLILPSVACILPGILVIVGGPAMLQLTESLADFGG